MDAAMPSVVELLARFRARPPLSVGERIAFGGVGDRDVYNLGAPFEAAGETIIAGRVESRDSELAEAVFFVERDGVWSPRPASPSFSRLQDPCVARIGGELIFGGVEFPVDLPGGDQGWRMRFYRGKSLQDLDLFLIGPDRMKDIRMLELPGGRIGVFSRPQGDRGGRGTLGFTHVDRLQDLTARAIAEAPLLRGQFQPEEWGGANEAHVLRGGRIGVLGHIARMDEAGKHYYPMVFALDPESGWRSGLKIIATRADFPPGPTKRPELEDVIFSGGLLRNLDGTAVLFAGISDAWAARITLPDPFLKYEYGYEDVSSTTSTEP
jgi:hypothetical protein